MFILIFSALSAAIIVSHALVAFGGERLRRIFSPVGIALHLPVLILLLLTENSKGRAIELDIVILFFTVSTLIYTSLFFAAKKIAENKHKRGEAVDV